MRKVRFIYGATFFCMIVWFLFGSIILQGVFRLLFILAAFLLIIFWVKLMKLFKFPDATKTIFYEISEKDIFLDDLINYSCLLIFYGIIAKIISMNDLLMFEKFYYYEITAILFLVNAVQKLPFLIIKSYTFKK